MQLCEVAVAVVTQAQGNGPVAAGTATAPACAVKATVAGDGLEPT